MALGATGEVGRHAELKGERIRGEGKTNSLENKDLLNMALSR